MIKKPIALLLAGLLGAGPVLADAALPGDKPDAEQMFELPEVKKLEPVPDNLFAPAAPADPDAPVIDLAADALEAYVTFFPARSTRIGVGSYDMMLGDYRKGSVDGFLGSSKGYLAQVDKITTAGLTDRGIVEREALRVYLRSIVRLLDSTSAQTRDPNFYVDESVGAIQVLLDFDTSGADTKAEHILARMSILKPFFAAARQNLGTCSKPAVRRAIMRLRASMPLFSTTVPSELLRSGHPQASLTGKQAVSAAWKEVSEFASWLETEKLDKGTKTEPLGEKGWREWLRSREETDLSSQQVLAAATADFEKLKDELRATAGKIAKKKSVGEQVADLSSERMVPDAAQSAAEGLIGELWGWFIKNQPTGTPSDESILVRTTPAFRRRDVPIRDELAGGYLKTPPSHLEIAAPDPDWPAPLVIGWLTAYSKQFLPLAVMREVYPGRFAAWAKMRQSKIRTCKAVVFPTMSDGWALYAEELPVRAGYGSDDPRLKLALLVDLVRADAVLIASIRMHTAGLSPNDALGWLSKEAYWSKEEAAIVAERAFVDPDLGAPALGRLAIQRLAADVRKAQGDKFTPRAFQDRLLSFGSAPISAVRRVMLPADKGPLVGAGK